MRTDWRAKPHRVAIATGCVALFGMTSAHAQVKPAPLAAAATGVVDEVVVTAQKREQAVGDVPITISHVSAQRLQEAGVVDLQNLQQVVPNVIISRTGLYPNPAIRGVTTQAAAVGAQNNIAGYQDGVYVPFLEALYLDLENVASIDVVKGPQGTLFGQNATGGAIIFNTPAPTSYFKGRVVAQYSAFNDRLVAAQFSGPITDKLSYAIAGAIRKSDGYITDVQGFDSAPVDNKSLNLRLRYEPTDWLTMELRYSHRNQSDATSAAFTGGTQLQPIVSNPLAYPGLTPTESFVTTKKNTTSYPYAPTFQFEYNLTALMVKVETPIGAVTNLLSYQRQPANANFSLTRSNYFGSHEDIGTDQASWQNEINLTSHEGGAVDYVVGAYLSDYYSEFTHFWFHSRQPTSATVYNVQSFAPEGSSRLDDVAYAAYADVTWHPTNALHLTAGLRYSGEKVKGKVCENVNRLLPPENPLLTFTAVCQYTTGPKIGQNASVTKTAHFKAPTPRLVARYELNDHTNVYASYSRGFKSGTIALFSAGVPIIEPEILDAFEIGYKTSHPTWTFDTAAYHYDYSDLQVSALVGNALGQQIPTTSNAAQSKIYGAEFQLDWLPTDALRVHLAGAYTHARYTEFKTYSPTLPCANVALCTAAGYRTTPPGTAVLGLQYPATRPEETDLSGQRFVRAPDWAFSSTVSYKWDLPKGDVTASGTYSWQSEFAPQQQDWALSDVVGTDGLIQPSNHGMRWANSAYGILNLRLMWQATDKFRLSGFVNNATDTSYYTLITGSTSGHFVQWGAPRTAGARIEYQF